MRKPRKPKIWAELLNMKAQRVKLEQIYLDPNNPRLEIPGKARIPNTRIAETPIQRECLDQIRKEGITDLTESIKTSGFWTVDRIVLRPLGSDRYVVVEGNRRIAALQTLNLAHEKGSITLHHSILKGILEFEALIYKGGNTEIAWIIQGFRHTPGIMSWERYPKSKFFADFEKESKKEIYEIASIFGMEKPEVTLLIRSYYAFEQAKEDEDYGNKLDPKKFGLFDEIIFKKLTLQNWLEWNDTKRKFMNIENFKKFLSWTTPKAAKEPKLNVSKYTRDLLSDLVKPENKKLFEEFEKEIEREDFDVETFYGKIYKEKERKEPIDISDIVDTLKATEKLINTLPIPQLQLAKRDDERKQKEEIVRIMERLVRIINIQLKNLEKT